MTLGTFAHKMKTMRASLVTTKGQIVIPAPLRRKVGIKKGTRVYIEEQNGVILIHPATTDFYQKTFGLLKGDNLVKILEQNRQQEKNL